ncbi:LacI family DNA-binding transcriptional regulator [Sneathia vaginalis]|uniref:LacI family DNA-binding transcriptional regulator n=1 Tax=Sneathia vaginalis TaxID=187101 RepID=UPI00259AFE99|nr:LacI family DNA-binding transcriptional regulator [uncultured Sneathia sp.]
MKKLTIKDIAKLAGVSFKTVSRVINNEDNVKEETKEKVKKILLEQNFSVNYNAKRLASSRTRQIGVITNTKSNELSKNYIILHHILTFAKMKDYTIIVHESLDKVKRNNLGKIDKGFYEGIIFLNPKKMEDIEEAVIDKLPVVMSGISDKYVCVGTDQYESGYIATMALIKKGCKNIAVILDDPDTTTNKEKVRGYVDALKSVGYMINDENIHYNYRTSFDVEALITKKYLKDSLYDGVLIGSDVLGLGAVRAINKLKIPCPMNFKFITFGNTFICNETYPSMSSIKQNFESIAKNLVDKIVELIENKDKPKSMVIPAEIIERESTI